MANDTSWETRYCGPDCNTFILYRMPDGRFDVDGCHGPDKDLTKTFQILEGTGECPLYYKLVIDDGWPTLTDITDEVKAACGKPRQFDPFLANLVRAKIGLEPLPDEPITPAKEA